MEIHVNFIMIQYNNKISLLIFWFLNVINFVRTQLKWIIFQMIHSRIQGGHLDFQMPKVNLFSWRFSTTETFSSKKLTYTGQAILRHEILFHRTAVETVYLVPQLIKKCVTRHSSTIISTAMLAYRYLITDYFSMTIFQ